MIANFTLRTGPRLSLFGYYALIYANSDTAGASSFPANLYDLALDYGRASFDGDSIFNDRPHLPPTCRAPAWSRRSGEPLTPRRCPLVNVFNTRIGLFECGLMLFVTVITSRQ